MSRIPRTYRISPDEDRAIKKLAEKLDTSEAAVVGRAVIKMEKEIENESSITHAPSVPIRPATRKGDEQAAKDRRIYGVSVQRDRTPILKPSAKSL